MMVAAIGGLLLLHGSVGDGDLPVRLSSTRPSIGTPLTWSTEVVLQPGERVRVDRWSVDGEAIQFLESRVLQDGGLGARVEIAWMPVLPGHHSMDAVSLRVVDASEQEVRVLRTAAASIDVPSTVPVGQPPVFAPLLEDPRSGDAPPGRALTVGVLLALILVGVGGFVIGRRRRRMVAGAGPAMTAEEALRRLDALARDGAADDPGFHVRLDALLRAYLDACLGLAAPRLASEEIVKDLEGRLPGPARLLAPLLEDIDRHKYAAARSGPAERASCVDLGRQFVQATAPSGAASSSAS